MKPKNKTNHSPQRRLVKKAAEAAGDLSGRQLAKWLGVSETAVRKMRAKGQITPVSRAGRRGADQYDLEEARRQRQQNVRPSVQPGAADDTLVQLTKAEKVEKVKRLHLANARTRGENVPVGAMRALLGELYNAVKGSMDRMVLELADLAAECKDPAEFKVAAQPYVDGACLRISEALKNLPSQPAA